MPTTVVLRIAGRAYEIACEESQAQALSKLGEDLDRRASGLLKSVGPVADTKLLVMVALTLADELHDTQSKPGHALKAAPAPTHDPAADQRLAAGLEALAARIESIAERVETA
jgi:cell division protein ZapA